MTEKVLPLQRRFLIHSIKNALGNVSQSQIAHATGFSERRISLWYNHQDPGPESLKQISKRIHTSEDQNNPDGKQHPETLADRFVDAFELVRDIENKSVSSDVRITTLAKPFLQQLGFVDTEGNPTDKLVAWLTTDSKAPVNLPVFISREQAFAKNSSESIWLNPHNHHSIPLSGRENERELLNRFVGHNASFLVGALIAPSGAGKTRLVSQWLREDVINNGKLNWDAGFVENRDATLWSVENWTPALNTLIIVDYTYNYSEIIEKIINRFKSGSSVRIRLLVLDHVLPENLHTDIAWKRSIPNRQFLEGHAGLLFQPFPIRLAPAIDDTELLREIVASAADPYGEKKRYDKNHPLVVKAVSDLMKIGAGNSETASPDERGKRDAAHHPLFAALAGQSIYMDPNVDFRGMSRRDLIKHYLETANRLPWLDENQNPHTRKLGPWVGLYVSTATLLRGISRLEIVDFQEQLPRNTGKVTDPSDFSDLIDICNRIVSSDDNRLVKPFEPDILGETFILKFLHRHLSDEKTIEALGSALSEIGNSVRQDTLVWSFLGTIQRMVRNLINDNQTQSDVRDSWDALKKFLRPNWFGQRTQIRRAISISLGDIVKQCSNSDLRSHVPDFIENVAADDLAVFRSSPLFYYAAIAAIHYINWLGSQGAIEESVQRPILELLEAFKIRSEDHWSALMLASSEGCLDAAKFLKEQLQEPINFANVEGMTALIVSSMAGSEQVAAWLLDEGADPNLETREIGLTALIAASYNGCVAIVDRLIQCGAVVNHQTFDTGATALIAASNEGHVAVVNRLVLANALVDQSTKDHGLTALSASSFEGHLGVVESLLAANASVNLSAKHTGWSPLMSASSAGHITIVERLIAAGANVDQSTYDNGTTALMAAAAAGHVEIVSKLICANSDVNRQTFDQHRVTALFVSAIGGHAEVTHILVAANAIVDITDAQNGDTALIAASRQGHVSVVDVLLTANAEVDHQRESDGMTALIAACIEGHAAVATRLLLAQASPNIYTRDDGLSALIAASAGGYVDIVERLILQGADVEQTISNVGATALMLASSEGHLSVVEKLLLAGVNVNKQSDIGVTALILASSQGRLDVVKRLVEAGAQVNTRTLDENQTALGAAVKRDHSDVIVFLRSIGATN